MKRSRDHGDYRRGASVHDCRAEAADDPGPDRRVGTHPQIVDILEKGKTGPNAESENRGIAEFTRNALVNALRE